MIIDTCPSNQWMADRLYLELEAAVTAEVARRQASGASRSLRTRKAVRQDLLALWLQCAVPAANA